ncbi:hypothetical protein PAECIP111893_01251 [Paenibacillus plantiphilus]|uniref:MPN domain-containing protein n=1 Tax=Paenibacillus plantiphilus TaxID=2905650 RepID=A0ABN8GAN1_9BACL|nr:M67 family metallopeptidase [Paenibacillus plantiphilus]CAH1199171.1 hypothetical protein PAECIP111893_01251 [Paenibacillus plantiphilus]
MIILTPDQIQMIRQHSEQDYPNECCGVVLGIFGEDGAKRAERLLPINNAREEEARYNRFLITSEDLMRSELQARRLGLDIVGFYHSHPDHPAQPSTFDLEHAWPTYSYLIVAVAGGVSAELTSWELKSDRSAFDQESIKEEEA